MIFLVSFVLLPVLSLLPNSYVDEIRTDGVINTEEWKDARAVELANGSKLLMVTRENTLYVALSSPEKFWAHVYLSDGREVKVMHASAALDAIHYKQKGSRWFTDEEFQYELRDKQYNDDTERKMQAYFESNCWVANNINIGDAKTIEFKLRLTPQAPVYFACVMSSYDVKFTAFPENLSDDTILQRLVQGNAVDSVSFRPETWHKVR